VPVSKLALSGRVNSDFWVFMLRLD